MITIINKKQSRYRGTSILEAAFVLIILLFITLGVLGFGWFFLRAQQVTNAARHGALIAIRYRVDEGTTQGEVVAAVDGLLNPVGLEHEAPSIDSPSDPNVGDAVTVEVTGNGLDVLNLDSGGILTIPIPDDFTASVTMAKEGPGY